MWHLKYFILFVGIHLATVTSKHVRFYRKDYTYNFEYDAFYKLHIEDNISWKTAFLTCENEESKLFYPSAAGEWQIVNKLREKMHHRFLSANIADVLIGLHNQFNIREFITVDGQSPPLPLGGELQHVEGGEACVIMNSTSGAYKKDTCSRPSPTLFVCKKMDNQPCPTTTCPTIDPDYKYSSGSRKCYKVNNNAKQWQEAIQTCYMEGGLLAVAENTDQVNLIRNVINLNQDTTYFIGIRNLFNNGDYYTVEGKNAGKIASGANLVLRIQDLNPYNTLGWKSRNADRERTPFDCGVISDQRIETASCSDKKPFICEIKASD